eukprot:jgi/Tetstr1/442606/TSEL_030702.t1
MTKLEFDPAGDTFELGHVRAEHRRPPSAQRSAAELQGDLLLGQKAKRATSKRVLLCAAVCGGLLLVLAIGFGVGFGIAPQSPGKTSWPECVGWTPRSMQDADHEPEARFEAGSAH